MQLKMSWDEKYHPLAILDKIEKYTRLYRYLSLCHKRKPILLHRNLSYMRKYAPKKKISLDDIISKLYLKAWNISINSNILNSKNEDEIIYLDFKTVQLITTPESINCCHHPQLPKEMTVEIYLTQQHSIANELNSVIRELHQSDIKARCSEVLLGTAKVPIIYEYYNYYNCHPASVETKIMDIPSLSSNHSNPNLDEDILGPSFGQKSVITSATTIKHMCSKSPITKQKEYDRKSSISLKLSDLSPIVKALTCPSTPLSYGDPKGLALKICAMPVIRPKEGTLQNSHHENLESGCFIETPPYDACSCYEESLSFALKLRSHVQSNGDAFNNFYISERWSGAGCTATSTVPRYTCVIDVSQLFGDPRLRHGPGVAITCTLMPQTSPRHGVEEDSGFSSLVDDGPNGQNPPGVSLKFRLGLSKTSCSLPNGQPNPTPTSFQHEREFLKDIHTTLSQAAPPQYAPKLKNGFQNSYEHCNKVNTKIRDVWIGTSPKAPNSPVLKSDLGGLKRYRHTRRSSLSANSEESSSDSGIPLRLLRTKLRKKRLNLGDPLPAPTTPNNVAKEEEPSFHDPLSPLPNDASKIFVAMATTGRKRTIKQQQQQQLTRKQQQLLSSSKQKQQQLMTRSKQDLPSGPSKESQKLAWIATEQDGLARGGAPSLRALGVRFFLGAEGVAPLITTLGTRPLGPPMSPDSLGHVCPWCFTACPQIYALLQHLSNFHFRFQFYLDITEDSFLIDAVPATNYELTFREEISNFIMMRSISLQKSRKINLTLPRTKRLPYTEIYAVCKSDYLTNQMNLLEFVHPKLLQFQPDIYLSSNSTNVKLKADVCKEETGQLHKSFHNYLSSCYRKSLTGHNRIYYRSSTYVPLFAQEVQYDSESETYPSWLVEKRCSLIDDFTDVDDDEKEFMKLWNRFMMQGNTFLGESHVFQACHTFISQKRQDLRAKKLTKNLIFHLCQIYHFELINASQHHELWTLYNEQIPET